MPTLPDLSALRLELGKKAEAIQANPPRFSNTTISKLREVFPDLRFTSDCIDGKTERRYVIFPYSFIAFSAAAVELFDALKSYKAVVAGASEKLGILQPDFEQIILSARDVGTIDEKLSRQISADLKEDKDDIARLAKFLTNYESWGGGKSIARQQDDFHISPILDSLGLQAESSGYVSNLYKTLSKHPRLVEEINNQALNAPKNNFSAITSSLTVSLLSKPFTILTGNSGTGKTRSAEDLAAMFRDAENPMDAKNVALVAVGADWTDNRSVVGFVNHLRAAKRAGAGEECPVYQSTAILDLLLEASRPGREGIPHFLILDEMNLSHVERYFADFLSAMEARSGAIRFHEEGAGNTKPETGDLKPESGTPEADFRLPRFEGDPVGVPRSLPYPQNLFVIGTVNVDETTYMFSPKVLDRAHVIEFEVDRDEVKNFLDDPKPLAAVPRAAAGQAEAFLQLSLRARGLAEPPLPELPPDVKTEVNRHLLEVLEILQNGRFEFAFRTAKEVVAYLKVSHELATDKAAWEATKWKSDLDDEILQKILPRLHGSRTRVGPLLGALGWYLHSGDKEEAMKFSPHPARNSPKNPCRKSSPWTYRLMAISPYIQRRLNPRIRLPKPAPPFSPAASPKCNAWPASSSKSNS
jgi:hypothetical protein